MADRLKLQNHFILLDQTVEAKVADRTSGGFQAEGSGWFFRLAVKQGEGGVKVQRH